MTSGSSPVTANVLAFWFVLKLPLEFKAPKQKWEDFPYPAYEKSFAISGTKMCADAWIYNFEFRLKSKNI